MIPTRGFAPTHPPLDVLKKSGQTERQRSNSLDSPYSQILKLKVVHLIAFFILAYVGTEVTLGGESLFYIVVYVG